MVATSQEPLIDNNEQRQKEMKCEEHPPRCLPVELPSWCIVQNGITTCLCLSRGNETASYKSRILLWAGEGPRIVLARVKEEWWLLSRQQPPLPQVLHGIHTGHQPPMCESDLPFQHQLSGSLLGHRNFHPALVWTPAWKFFGGCQILSSVVLHRMYQILKDQE